MAKEEVLEPEVMIEQTEATEAAGQEVSQLVQQVQQELAEMKDRYLRALADLANLKKKMAHERQEARERGVASVIEELLPILDNFERAQEAMNKESNGNGVQALKEGVELIYNQLRANLKKRGVETIKALGEQFDPYYHEAAGQVPTDEVEEGRVVNELQRGYRIGTHVIRPSRVMVAMKPGER